MAVFKVDPEVINGYVIEQFKKMAAVPRPTNYMEKISAYLSGWAKEHGFEHWQDKVGNVIFDVPATKGCEGAPLTILQAHMDMVCVAEEGKAFDKFNDPISVIQKDGFLTAEGTSMGGDDAIGIAMAMYAAVSDDVTHGPLRVICTVNEEGGDPSGAGNLEHRFVTEAGYLINIDSEDYATCTVAACGFAAYPFSFKCTREATVSGQRAYKIELSGLLGGHSGVDIAKNRASAIKAVNYILAQMTHKKIPFYLNSFNGGVSMAAIPPNASAVVVVDEANEGALKEIFEFTKKYFAKQFDRTEAGYIFTCNEVPLPEKALTAADSAKAVSLIAAVRVGVNTISQRYAGITESSINIGQIVFNEGDESFNLFVAMRTSSEWPVMLANVEFASIAAAMGVSCEFREQFSIGWVEKEGAKLPGMYAEAFEEYTGDKCVITAVHGGLECAAFSQWSEDIEIISVGPTVVSPHSTGERIPIETIGKTAGAIANLLGKIALM